jgi:hypothetical protein
MPASSKPRSTPRNACATVPEPKRWAQNISVRA